MSARVLISLTERDQYAAEARDDYAIYLILALVNI